MEKYIELQFLQKELKRFNDNKIYLADENDDKILLKRQIIKLKFPN